MTRDLAEPPALVGLAAESGLRLAQERNFGVRTAEVTAFGATPSLPRVLGEGPFSIAASVKLRPDDYMLSPSLRSG